MRRKVWQGGGEGEGVTVLLEIFKAKAFGITFKGELWVKFSFSITS